MIIRAKIRNTNNPPSDSTSLYKKSLQSVSGFLGPNISPRDTYDFIIGEQKKGVDVKTRKLFPKFMKWATRNGIEPIALREMVDVDDNKPETYKKAVVLYPKPKEAPKKEIKPIILKSKEISTETRKEEPLKKGSPGLALPKGVKPELLVDKSGNYNWFYEGNEGDLVLIRKATAEEVKSIKK